jgi:hypothetical protein
MPFAPQHGVAVYVQLAYCRAWQCSCRVLVDLQRSGTQYGIHGKRVPYRLSPPQHDFYMRYCAGPAYTWDRMLPQYTADFY